MSRSDDTQNWREGFYSSQDGLRLYARRYPAADPGRRPVLCLAGLTRNSKDFHPLATDLSAHAQHPRDVYCLDYRGRGRSAYDSNWKNYTPYIELIDVLDFMTVAGLHDAAVLGSSRGGIIAMQMAVMRPAAIGVAVLNDIGAVIDPRGLARIIGYVGQTPVPSDWREAAQVVRDINEKYFTAFTDEVWTMLARQWYAEEDGRPAPGYDPNLANTMAEIDLAEKIPDMWQQFGALTRMPTLVIRGENSDILSVETVEEMAARHAKLQRFTVTAQGHAPLLDDAPTIRRIAEFLAETEDAGEAP